MANELKFTIAGDAKGLTVAIQGAQAGFAELGGSAKLAGADMDAAIGRSSQQMGRLNEELDSGATAMGRMKQAARDAGVALREGFDTVVEQAKTLWEEVKTHYERVLVTWGIALAVGISAAIVGAVYTAFKGVSFAIGLLTGESYKSANIDALIAVNKEVKELQALLPVTAVGASALNEALKTQGITATEYAATLNAVRTAQQGNGDELDRLGVKYKTQQGQLLDTNTVLTSAAAVLAKYKEGWDRNQAAQAIGLGTEKQIQDALAITTEKVQTAKDRLVDYNLIIGEDTQAAVARYESAMKDFNREADLTSLGFKKAIADNIMPALTDMADFFKDGFPAAVNVFRYTFATITSLFYGLKTSVYIVAEAIIGSVSAMGSALGGVASASVKALNGDFAGARSDLVQGWTEARDRLAGVGTNIVDQATKNSKAMALAWGADSLAAKEAATNIVKVGTAWKGKDKDAANATAEKASDYDRLSKSIEGVMALAEAELSAERKLTDAEKFRINTLKELNQAYANGGLTDDEWDKLYDRTHVVASTKAIADNTAAYKVHMAALQQGNAEIEHEIKTGEVLSAAQKNALKILKEITDGTRKYTEVETLALTAELERSILNERINAQRKAQFDADTKATDALAQEVTALREGNTALRQHNEEIGLSQTALNALVLARQDEAIAIQQSIVSENDEAVARGEGTAAMKLQIDKLDELQRKRGLTATGQAGQLAADAAKKAEEAWVASEKKIEDGLYDAVANGFQGGIKKAFGDIKQWLARQVLSFAVEPFAQFGASLLNPNAAGAGGAGGAGGAALGLAQKGLSLYSNAGLVANQVLRGTMSVSNGVGTVAANATGAGIDGLLATNGAYRTLATPVMSASAAGAAGVPISQVLGESGFAAATGAAGTGGTGLAAAGAFGESAATGAALASEYVAASTVIAEGAAVTGAAVGTAAGAAAGTGLTAALAAVPVWGWIALGALAIFGASGGGKGPKLTNAGNAAATFDPTGKQTGYETYFGGSNAATDKVISGLQTTYAGTAKALGIGQVASNFSYGGNIISDGKDAKFALGGGAGSSKFYQAETPLTDAELALASSRAVFAALQGSDLPKYLAGVFDGIVAGESTQEQLKTAIATAQAFKGLHDQLEALPFTQLKDMTYAVSAALVAASGGMQQFQTNIGTFYDKFVPEAEKNANVMGNLTKTFGELGLTLPAIDENARKAFRALVDGQDLATEAGVRNTAALLGVAGAFDQVSSYADAVAKAALDAGKQAADKRLALVREELGWQDKKDVLTKRATQAEVSERNDLAAASNDTIRALIRQTYAQEALAAALDKARAATQAALQNFVSATSAVVSARAAMASQYGSFAAAVAATHSAADAAQSSITNGYLGALDAVAAAQADVANVTQQSGQALRGFAKTIRDFIAGLDHTDTGGLDKAGQLASAQADFAINLAQAKAGDTEALGRLTGIAGAMLTAGKDQAESQVDYRLLVLSTKGQLAGLAGGIDSANPEAAKANPEVAARLKLAKAQEVLAEYQKAATESGASTAKQVTDYAADWRKANQAYLRALGDKSIADQLVGALDVSLRTPLENLADAVRALGLNMANQRIAATAAGTSVVTTTTSAADASAPREQIVRKGASGSYAAVTGATQEGDEWRSSAGAVLKVQGGDAVLYGTGGGSLPLADARAWIQRQTDPLAVYQLAVREGISATMLDQVMGWQSGSSNQYAVDNNLPKFDVGTNYVTKDMKAIVHEGEAIVPKAYNPAAGGGWQGDNQRLERLVEALTAEVQRLQQVVREGNNNTRQLADQFDQVSEGANGLRTVAV